MVFHGVHHHGVVGPIGESDYVGSFGVYFADKNTQQLFFLYVWRRKSFLSGVEQCVVLH